MFTDLPLDILHVIFDYLDSDHLDLLALRRTCKTIYKILTDKTYLDFKSDIDDFKNGKYLYLIYQFKHATFYLRNNRFLFEFNLPSSDEVFEVLCEYYHIDLIKYYYKTY